MSRLLLIAVPNFSVHPDLVQEEKISSIAESFASFEPTAIAIEKNYYVEEEVNKNLDSYLREEFILTYDALEQFSFRTAEQAGLAVLYMVDEIVNMSDPSLDQVFTWVEEYQPSLLKEIISIKQKADAFRTYDDIQGVLEQINSDTYITLIQHLHASINIAGDRYHQVGTAWLKQYFEKNLAIAANLERMIRHEERIIAFVSEETLPLLKNLLKNSNRITLEHPDSYLTRHNSSNE
ncbi:MULTISPECIES: DUF5694 domain-containing protein [Salimicrobium]|uniref:Uncharacterized protein n=3 Tax=Salimicrobium TaxID=351195 RepID=K2GBV2_9BACI|nr:MULTISPECIES: DUF5694 domain-containing protein [Salimicrobium]AKG05109.1 hypothetical protein AAV35_010150 [Salimicrobium jeotgali]EKE32523.1 hypothetical protein MJ3_03782 [Salimicrobium jeotgali]MBM7695494.1 hypothetical protein [Salimicrobium jeotgali]SDY15469.1 hypothetical protein SAMN04488081_2235 [Salimicrobium album]SIS77949.1 hypothetical protein SAMN05421758_105218 [Salimicrobium salexigens]